MKINWYAKKGKIVVQCEDDEDRARMEEIFYVVYGLCELDMSEECEESGKRTFIWNSKTPIRAPIKDEWLNPKIE